MVDHPNEQRMKKSSEPFWWALFGGGGVMSAMFLPVMLFITGIAIPLGWIAAPSYDSLHMLLQSVISRLLMFGVISLSMFHWAHRFRFTLQDGLQLKRFDVGISIICYGAAILTTVWAGYLLWNF
jgi:fumarate reductase subunit D